MGKRTVTARKRSGPMPRRKAAKAVRKPVEVIDGHEARPVDGAASSPEAMRRLIQREFAFDDVERTQEDKPAPEPTVPSGFSEAAVRWRKELMPFPAAEPDFQFTDGDVKGANSNWLWTACADDASDRPRPAFHLSTEFAKAALKLAIIANGGTLVALALVTQLLDTSPRLGVEAAAIALGLGLAFAAASAVLACLNFQLSDAYEAARREESKLVARIKASFWLATGSGAGSYAAFALGAIWLH